MAKRADETEFLLQLMVKRLDAIIGVLLETATQNGKPLSTRDRIRILSAAELRPTEIARILGITPLHVSTELHELRKRKIIPKRKTKPSASAQETTEQKPTEPTVQTASL